MSAWHRDQSHLLGQHALVIGGSLAGLVAARVLSPRFGRVTIVDRDAFPASSANRRGVPQGWHGHGLLASGLRGLVELFPGLLGDLVNAGAVQGDVVGSVRWFQHGCYKLQFDSGLGGVLLSRALLEHTVRSHVRALRNVDITTGAHVLGLAADEARRRVTGVRVLQGSSGRSAPVETIYKADLVVDASGRATRAPEWLEHLGYARPPVDEVTVGLGYTTRTFVREPRHLDGLQGAIIAPTPPLETRGGFALAMEHDRWIVSLCGWTGDHAPATPDGYLEYARSLPRPDIYDLVKTATPLSDPVSFVVPASVRRRYERLSHLPEAFVAIGDSIAAFNPVYGQGMSVATLEALELARCLGEHDGLTAIGRRFFRRAAKVVDTPWTIAVGSDFGFAGVTGPRPPGTSLVNWYLDHVHDAASTDQEVCRAFFNVANLLAGPATLFHPSTVARVIRARLRDEPRRTTAHSSASIAPARSDRTTRGSRARRPASSSAR